MPVYGVIMTVVCYLSLVIVMSGLSFALYGFDKRRARVAGRRVSEQTLHLLAFMGGWPGAFLGQQYFRHKTQKASFLITFWLIACLHVAVVASLTYVFTA